MKNPVTPAGIKPTNCTYPSQFLTCCCCCRCRRRRRRRCHHHWPLKSFKLMVPGFKSRHRQSKKFLSSKRPQNSEAHPITYWMGTGVLPRGIKRLGREVDHLPASSAEVKNGWSYTSTPHIYLHDAVSLLNGLANDKQFAWFWMWVIQNSFQDRHKLYLSLLYPSHDLCILLRLDV